MIHEPRVLARARRLLERARGPHIELLRVAFAAPARTHECRARRDRKARHDRAFRRACAWRGERICRSENPDGKRLQEREAERRDGCWTIPRGQASKQLKALGFA